MNNKLKIIVCRDLETNESVEVSLDAQCIVEFVKQSLLDKEDLHEPAVEILKIAKLSGNIEASSILSALAPKEMAVVPARSYSGIIEFLANKYRLIGERWCMIGILFIRPGNKTHDRLIRELEYYHHRSSHYFDIFVAGYEAKQWGMKSYTEGFSAELFSTVVAEFESISQWKYGGGSELMLTNVKPSSGNTISLDFSSSILINLDDLVETNGFADIGYFFEHLFQWSRRTEMQLRRTGRFSDNYIKERFPKEIIDALMRWLPLSFGKDIKEISSFAVRNIEKT